MGTERGDEQEINIKLRYKTYELDEYNYVLVIRSRDVRSST